MKTVSSRPINLAIAALGGQGGGVLANWIVATAESCGFIAQATSVPGVAQRTGATIYYIEMIPVGVVSDTLPVFALNPIPGDLDIVIAAELMEAGRAIQRGFVSPDRTTLITSSHRVWSTLEKSALGDGTLDGRAIREVGPQTARNFFCFDMAKVADNTGSVISAVLLGALAGCDCLPFSRSDYETTIRADGRSIEANLAGFLAGIEQLKASGQGQKPATHTDAGTQASDPEDAAAGTPLAAGVVALLQHLETSIPQPCRQLARHGLRRVVDYQDIKYGELYISRLSRFAAANQQDYRLCQSVTRQLATRMSYEDTPRVAELKTRAERVSKIKEEVKASPDQQIHVTEFLHPRVEEICDTLPAWLGAHILASKRLSAAVGYFCRRGRKITTTRLSGFLLLNAIASLKRWRRGSYRYQRENSQIEAWLDRIEACLPQNYELAVEISNCADLIKGYGDTHARGLASFNRIMAFIDAAAPGDNTELAVRELRRAALADEEGDALTTALTGLISTR